MKIVTIVGARPQFVKAAAIIRALARSGTNIADRLISTRYVKHFLTERFDDLFCQEGRDLLERGRPEQPALARRMAQSYLRLLVPRPGLLPSRALERSLAGRCASAARGACLAVIERRGSYELMVPVSRVMMVIRRGALVPRSSCRGGSSRLRDIRDSRCSGRGLSEPRNVRLSRIGAGRCSPTTCSCRARPIPISALMGSGRNVDRSSLVDHVYSIDVPESVDAGEDTDSHRGEGRTRA